jgi:hypothetical protein
MAFLTNDMIAREALAVLTNSLVTTGLVYRDYENEWNSGYALGQTVGIRRPATFEAKEFDQQAGIEVQTATEGRINLTLEKHFDVSFEVTTKDRTLSITDFSNQLIVPAMNALGDAVNGYILSKYAEVPYFYDAGTSNPAFPDTVAKIVQIGAALDTNRVPLAGRNGVVSPSAKATLLGLEAFWRADARGDNGTALREASLGRVLGLDWWMDQQVKRHTAGTFSEGTPAVNGAVLAGATTMNIDGGVGTETLKKGDLFTVADVAGQYVVTADATATGGAITGVTFYPPAPVGGFPNDKAITVKKSHKANLAFVRNAFAFAAVPLAMPSGNAPGQYVSYNGVGIRMVSAYDVKYKKDTMSFDILCGARCIQPELALRVLEAP